MKKLMIAAAIVCAAAVSQAATVAWSSTDKAYGATGWASIADITVGAFAADDYDGQYMDKITGISWEFTGKLTKEGGASEDIGGAVNWSTHKGMSSFESDLFVLPTDESGINYSWEVQMVGTFKKGDQEYTITSDVLTGSNGYTKMSSEKITTPGPTSWTVAAVPEPTSGLLLLLGVAGLALRRRRA